MFINALRVRLLAVVFAAFTPLSYGQQIKYEAVQLVEMATQATWETAGPLLDGALLKLEMEMEKKGALKPAEAIFIEEFKKSLTRENFSKAFAVFLSGYMTEPELKETIAFYKTSAGQKWLKFSSPESTQKFTQFVLAEACTRTKTRTTFLERQGELSQLCD